MEIAKNILDLIGNTPIMRINSISDEIGVDIYAKLEFLNPGGSIKERIAKYIITKALQDGIITAGGTVVEATSGNTGIGVAICSRIMGLKSIIVLTDKQSPEKLNHLRSLGAQIVICPASAPAYHPDSIYNVAEKIHRNTPNSFYLNQYDNPLSIEAHYKHTGPEIYKQTDGKFDLFVAGVGTGGTISGTARFLKSKMPKLKVVGVDIEGSILAHYHKTGEEIESKAYVLEGIGEDKIPLATDFDIIDDFVVVHDEECFHMTRRLMKEEALYVGGSSGAAIVAITKYCKKHPNIKSVVTIFPDSGNRYASRIYNDDWMKSKGYTVD